MYKFNVELVCFEAPAVLPGYSRADSFLRTAKDLRSNLHAGKLSLRCRGGSSSFPLPFAAPLREQTSWESPCGHNHSHPLSSLSSRYRGNTWMNESRPPFSSSRQGQQKDHTLRARRPEQSFAACLVSIGVLSEGVISWSSSAVNENVASRLTAPPLHLSHLHPSLR